MVHLTIKRKYGLRLFNPIYSISLVSLSAKCTFHQKFSADRGKFSADHWKFSADHGKFSADHWKFSADRGKFSAEHGKFSADFDNLSLVYSYEIK